MSGRTRPPEQQAALERYFKGLPIEEAKVGLYIVPTREDISTAVKGDPANCAFSRACQRTYGSTATIFLRAVAYIDVPDAKGKRRVLRFRITPTTRKLIENFDRGKKVLPGGFELLPPHPSHTLEQQRKRMRAYHKRHRQALLKGEMIEKRPPHDQTKSKALTLEGVRHGTGRVQFTKVAA